MPNRVIRDGLLSSDSFNALPPDAQMLYVRILLVVDDYGRFDGRDAAIKSACYPVSDIRLTDVSKMLTTLVGSRLIQRYDATGHTYISVPRFNQRLRIKRERHPAPPEFECISDSDSDSDSGRHMTGMCQTDDGHVSDIEISQETPLSDVVSRVDTYPPCLDIPAFHEAWGEWDAHRREKKKPITPRSRGMALKQLEAMGPDRAIAAIENSIANGYQGIFEPKASAGGSRYGPKDITGNQVLQQVPNFFEQEIKDAEQGEVLLIDR